MEMIIMNKTKYFQKIRMFVFAFNLVLSVFSLGVWFFASITILFALGVVSGGMFDGFFNPIAWILFINILWFSYEGKYTDIPNKLFAL